MSDPATRQPDRATVVVVLKDGQQIDLTGMPPAAAIAYLETLGVSPPMIRHTVHTIHGRGTRPA